MRRTVASLALRRALPFALAATAGCAPAVHLPRPDVQLPQAFETRAQRPDGLAPDRWWTDFHDPQLEALVTTALARSTTIRLAYARIEEARATRRETRASTLPTGELTGSATRQGSWRLWGSGISQGGYDTYAASFAPSWELDLFGRLAATRTRADLTYRSSALDFYGTRLALAGDVAADLFQARYLAVQLADARDNLRIAQDLARTGALGRAHGLTSDQDAARLDADAAGAEAETTRLEAELKAAKRSLLILTGQATAPTDTLAIAARLGAPPSLPDLAPGALLMRRPDVRGAEVALQAAAKTIRIDRLALFPHFSISPSLGLTAGASAFDGIDLSALGGAGGSGGTGLWSLVGNLAMPVLDRAKLLAALRVSEAQGKEAVISYEQAVQTAFGEAENALTRVAGDDRRIGQLEQATARAKTAFDEARRGYGAGLTDLTTLLQAEQIWVQDRGSLGAARFALLSDTVTAIRALGGGWNPQASLDPGASLDPHAPLTAASDTP